jgi:hypothetical protein
LLNSLPEEGLSWGEDGYSVKQSGRVKREVVRSEALTAGGKSNLKNGECELRDRNNKK